MDRGECQDMYGTVPDTATNELQATQRVCPSCYMPKLPTDKYCSVSGLPLYIPTHLPLSRGYY